MKKTIMWRCAAAMLLAAGLALPVQADVAKMAPESTEVLIRMPSVETLFNLFSITENSILGQPLEDMEDAEEELGFNPLKLSELKARGLDTSKPFGLILDSFEFSAETEEPSFNGAAFLPVTDAGKAIKALKAMISKETPDLEWSKDGDLTVFKGIDGDGDGVGYMLPKAGHLFIGAAPKKDAKPFMERIAKADKGLAAVGSYKEVAAKLPSGREIFGYVDAVKMVERNLSAIKKLAEEESSGPEMTKNLDYLKEWKGAGAGIDFDTKDLVVDSVIDVKPDAKTLAVVKDVPFDKNIVMGVKDAPLLLLSFAVNARQYYDMMMASLEEEQRQSFANNLEGIKAGFGVDPVSDVIDNLAGNLNLGVYDGMSINMANYNVLLTLNLKDGAKMTQVIETAISKLPPEQQSMVQKTTVGAQESYMISLMGMTQLFLGVKDKNLIVAVGKPMYDKALAADVKTGFLTRLKDPDLVAALKSDAASILYLDAQETFKAVKNFAPMLQQFSKDPSKPFIDETVTNAVNQFDYLLSASQVKGNSIVSSLALKTNFVDPFFQGVANVVESFKERAAEQAKAAESAEGTTD